MADVTELDILSYLAEASSGPRVTDSWLSPIPVAVAGKALGEVIKPRSAAVARPPRDSGLAPIFKAKEAPVFITVSTQFSSPPALLQSSSDRASLGEPKRTSVMGVGVPDGREENCLVCAGGTWMSGES